MAHRLGPLLLAIVLQMWLAAPSSAQPKPTLRVVSDKSVSNTLRKRIERALGAGYLVELGHERNLDQKRLRRVLQQQLDRPDLDLLVLASAHKQTLALRYIDVRSQRSLGTIRLRVAAGPLSLADRRRLLGPLREAIAAAARDESGLASGALALAPTEGQTVADDAAEAEDGATGEQSIEPEPEDDSVSASARLNTDADANAEETADPTAAQNAALSVLLEAGVGSSFRGVELTSDGVTRAFDSGPAFAVDIGLSVQGLQRELLSWLFTARYHTSLGLDVNELRVNAPDDKLGLRTHGFEAGVGFRLGLGIKRGWALSPVAGYAMRSLSPELHHALIPFYTLGGPFARLELTVPWDELRLGLRISPEAQWLPQASAIVGGSGASGMRLALSAQATLFLHLGAGWDVELAFRESHAWVRSDVIDVADIERFVLVRGVWRP